MKKEKLEKMMNNFCSFSYWILKQLLAMALIGVMAILYYQAGRAEMFNYPANADEFCEQHEKELEAPNDVVIDLKTKNEGEKKYEE